jgi:hypothetical protein
VTFTTRLKKISGCATAPSAKTVWPADAGGGEDRDVPSPLRDSERAGDASSGGVVAYAVGTGRCGTLFLKRLLELEPAVSSVHERNPLNETFHRYCKWYGLDIDSEGFLHEKGREIEADLAHARLSFESSAYLSLSVVELYERFGAKFVLMVRRPEDVINSYLRKGWYATPLIKANADLPPSYQANRHFHHFLGRIAPTGEKFNHWQDMSRVGKLAWYWNALNERVLEQFAQIPGEHWQVYKLEEFRYPQYLELARFLGLAATVSRQQFDALVSSRPNALDKVPSLQMWDDTEIAEFEREVRPMADRFGYQYRIRGLQERRSQVPVREHYRPREDSGVLASLRSFFRARC